MHTQLQLLESSIRLPQVTIERRGLSIPKKLATETLPQIGQKMLAIRNWLKWGFASLFTEMTARELKEAKPDTKSDSAPETDRVSEFCDAAGIDPKEKRELLAIHAFYPPKHRIIDLSYEHYREAMWGVDDGKPQMLHRALAFLRLAKDNDWSVTELRRHIRKEGATETPEPRERQTEFSGYGAVFDICRWAAKEIEHVDSMEPEAAQQILTDLGPNLPILITKLQARASLLQLTTPEAKVS